MRMIRSTQPSAVCSGESYADEMSSSTPGRASAVADRLGRERHRLLRPEHVEPVAALPAHDRHVREDRREGPDVRPELVDRLAVRDPLHHDPAGLQVVAPGLVVLERRDDRHARALDRRRRVRHDDVVAPVGQLQVVAAVGHDDAPVGLREDRRRVRVEVAEHRRHGRHQLHRVRLQPGDHRAAEGRAHAERHDEDVRGLGPQDERQDRHELGVDREQRHRGPRHPQLPRAERPRLDRRDLVLARREDLGVRRRAGARPRGPRRPCPRRGPPTTTARATPSDRRDRQARDALPDRGRAARARPQGRRSTSTTSPTAGADPTAGITKNGTTNVPTIAPSVLTASRSPALVAIRPSPSETSPDAAGKLRPMTIVAGRTTRTTRAPAACRCRPRCRHRRAAR